MQNTIASEKRAEAVRWLGGVRPCEDCSAYTPVESLFDHGDLLLCRRCRDASVRRAAGRAQQSLFDQQGELEWA